MEKNKYAEIQRAARRSKLNLSASIIYVIIFIFFSGIVISYLVPNYYYQYFNRDLISYAEGERPGEVERNLATSLYSKTEQYRRDWFDLSQSNLNVSDSYGRYQHVPFGKIQSYNLLTKVGFRYYPVAEIENRYVLSSIIGTEINEKQGAPNRSNQFYGRFGGGEGVSDFETLLEYLAAKGQFHVANVKVSFKLPQSKDVVDNLVANQKIELIRYGVDYPQNPNFGYPAYAYTLTNTKYNYREDDFLRKLKNVKAGFKTYGNLHLFGRDNFITGDNRSMSYMGDSNLTFLTNLPIDFQDASDYIEHNGVKYSSLLVTGSTADLTQWLKTNRDLINILEIQNVIDWNDSLIGGNDTFGND